MNMLDKLHSEELYLPDGEEIMSLQAKCLEKQYDYNNTRPSESALREKLLKEMFAEIGENCYIEPSLAEAQPMDSFQFVRHGYFCVDSKDSTKEHMVFNRIVSLKNSYRPK